jgi:hypothetical protein
MADSNSPKVRFPFVDGNSSFILLNSSLFLKQEEDARREKVLSEMGLRIVRFRNEEVVRDFSAVVGNVREMVESCVTNQ